MMKLLPNIYTIGLDRRILDVVECYLGLHCYYLGATLKREEANGLSEGTRQWHLDLEDEQMFRVIIYLSDVGPGAGPFEYIARQESQRAKSKLGYKGGYLDFDQLQSAVPAASPNAFYASSAGAIFFDGINIFHRAQPPTAVDRYSLTLSYSSNTPLELRMTARLSKRVREGLAKTLTPEQEKRLAPPRLL